MTRERRVYNQPDEHTVIPKITREGMQYSNIEMRKVGPNIFNKLKKHLDKENPILADFIARHAKASHDPDSVELAMLDMYLLLESQYKIENEFFPEELDA